MQLAFIVACIILSGVAAHFGYPLVHDNSDAVTVMATVLTVFAGFLVAIIAILGDAAIIEGDSWRDAQNIRPKLEAMVIRHVWLFYIYLAALGLLIAGVLLKKEPDAIVSPYIKSWVEMMFMFFGVLSFLLTLALPPTIGKIQLARNQAEIEARRAAVGIKKR